METSYQVIETSAGESHLSEVQFHRMTPEHRIVVNPLIRSGKPYIKGTRIGVADVLDYLGGGMTPAEILDDFPDLTAQDIQACLVFAAERERGIDQTRKCTH